MQIQDTKYCKGCDTRKAKTDFYVYARGYISTLCKVCSKAKSNQWNRDNHATTLENARYTRIRVNHGLPHFVYDRKLRLQNYLCAICGCSISGKNAHLDHNHATNKHRDFLCNNCNQGLGRFKDNPELLRQAALYLERHDTSSSE